MKATARAVARRYAHALLEAGAEPTPPTAERLAQELHDSVYLLRDHPQLARLLSDPVIPTEAKKRTVETVWRAAGTSTLMLRFLLLLADHGRMGVLVEIEEAFRSAWNEQRGVVEAEVVSALPLSDAQTQALEKALQKVSGRAVDLRPRLDPKVLGGVLVRMTGKSYDGTVRGRLRALKNRLVYGAAEA